MPERIIQPSFAGGEYSPHLYSRIDIERYRIGLKTSRNGYSHPYGGWSNRPGTKKVARAKNDGKIRLVKFVFSKTQAYVLEFGDSYIRFYKNRAQILDTGVLYEIATPYALSDIPTLRIESSADTIYITHNNYTPMTLSRYADTDWRLEKYSHLDGPFMDENTDETSTIAASATTGAITLSATDDIFDVGHIGALWQISHYITGQKKNASFIAPGVSTNIPCYTTWRVISHGTWTGEFDIEKSTDGGVTWTVLQSFTSTDDFNANTYGTEDPTTNLVPFLIRINMTACSGGTAYVDLFADGFYQEGIVEITGYIDSKHVTANVLQSIGSTDPTFTWAEGAWSDYRGYPALCRFYKDRLCFANSKYQPMTEWMTQTGNYNKFARNGISLLATDGITTTLTSRQLNAINGLLAFKSQLLLTSGATWSISPVSGDSLKPDTISQDIEEYYGSEGIEPVTIGNEAIYVQLHGKIVRNISFQLGANGFVGSDINIFSRHLTKDNKIIEMDFQQNPDSVIWAVMEDGQLLSLTYLKEQDVCSWSHSDTDGKFESLCVIPGTGYDEVWLAVYRDGKRFIEVMEDRLTQDVRLSYFVDCGITFNTPLTITNVINESPAKLFIESHGLSDDDIIDVNNIVADNETQEHQLNRYQFKIKVVDANTIALYEPITSAAIDGTEYDDYVSGGVVNKAYNEFSGLDWLEGKEVAILANGMVMPKQTVIDGKINFEDYYSVINVGLPYDSDLETLNIEVPRKDGTSQGRKIKISNVVFRLVDSRGGYVGPSELDQYNKSALYEAFIPSRDALSKTIKLFTGDRRVSLGAGYSSGGRVFFRQSDPLPVTITSIIPESYVGGVITDE